MDTTAGKPGESQPTPDFDEIVEKHADFVYNVAFRMMGQREDAEDVAQEAFISAYTVPSTASGASPGSPRGCTESP